MQKHTRYMYTYICKMNLKMSPDTKEKWFPKESGFEKF